MKAVKPIAPALAAKPKRVAAALAVKPKRVAAALAVVALCAPGPALAGEPARVPLTIRAGREAWQIEPAGSSACGRAQCSFALPRGTYEFKAEGVRERFELAGPTSLTLHRGSPFWHRASGYAMLGGLLIGGGALVGAIKYCEEERERRSANEQFVWRPCKDGPHATDRQNLSIALYATSGVGFAAAFVGVFTYFATGDWVSVRTEGPRPARRPNAWTFSAAPLPGGARGAATLRF